MNESDVYKLKARLRATAEKKFPGDAERQNRYVWGTINRVKRV